MNSHQLIQDKTKYLVLDDKIVKDIKILFNLSTTKQKKVISKKSNNLKNFKFRQDKNKISNKMILILNKITETNVKNLLIEFICNIEIKSLDDYKIIQEDIFLKILKDISFIDNTINFIINIFKIVNNLHNYKPYHFFDIISNYIEDVYLKSKDNEFDFFEKLYDENNRNSFIILLNKLIKINIINNEFDFSNILLNQNDKIVDIYNWFTLNESTDNEKSKIREKLNTLLLSNRENILLTSLLEKNETITRNIIIDNDEEILINNDTFTIEITNLFDEYVYLKDENEIIEYLKESSLNFDSKNLLCEKLLKYYFSNFDSEIKWFKLINVIISKKLIFKSNLSKALKNQCHQNEHDKTKIKELLILFKQNNITKNIENIFKKYKIKINNKY